eukprot:comp16681_c0_seq1/m.14920 comp16681_c0_seq1/g.14920  ORF comp16681_c0_seq1/g.14920 comp16681_c0_seq1/m.14920 type:complete len:316 (-) comp16681_c0_seq1:521-1468(-)
METQSSSHSEGNMKNMAEMGKNYDFEKAMEVKMTPASVDVMVGQEGEPATAIQAEQAEKIGFMSALKLLLTPRTLIAIFLGQFLSLLLIGTGVTSRYLAVDHNFNLPQFQSLLTYMVLTVVFMPVLIAEGGFKRAFGNFAWVKWLILGLIDVEGNFMVVKAYQYASITSVQLLDNFTVPAVVALSLIFLCVRYRLQHVVGVLICLAGILTLVTRDIINYGLGGGDQEALGDILILAGSLCYAISNVAQEFLLKGEVPVYEWLAMIGLSGSLVGDPILHNRIFSYQRDGIQRERVGSFDWIHRRAIHVLLVCSSNG